MARGRAGRSLRFAAAGVGSSGDLTKNGVDLDLDERAVRDQCSDEEGRVRWCDLAEQLAVGIDGAPPVGARNEEDSCPHDVAGFTAELRQRGQRLLEGGTRLGVRVARV